MTLDSADDRFLVWEVLIHRSDADTGDRGHALRREASHPFASQNRIGGRKHHRHRLLASLLPRCTAFRGLRLHRTRPNDTEIEGCQAHDVRVVGAPNPLGPHWTLSSKAGL